MQKLLQIDNGLCSTLSCDILPIKIFLTIKIVVQYISFKSWNDHRWVFWHKSCADTSPSSKYLRKVFNRLGGDVVSNYRRGCAAFETISRYRYPYCLGQTIQPSYLVFVTSTRTILSPPLHVDNNWPISLWLWWDVNSITQQALCLCNHRAHPLLLNDASGSHIEGYHSYFPLHGHSTLMFLLTPHGLRFQLSEFWRYGLSDFIE